MLFDKSCQFFYLDNFRIFQDSLPLLMYFKIINEFLIVSYHFKGIIIPNNIRLSSSGTNTRLFMQSVSEFEKKKVLQHKFKT